MLDKFTKAYIIAALWSTPDDNGESLDINYNIEDLSEETLTAMIEDCRKFQQENNSLLTGLDPESCGHDFWLTRNHHGAGFWDRGWGEIGDKLTEVSHKYNEVDLYVGDDNKIYA